jgi:hypothetical protein
MTTDQQFDKNMNTIIAKQFSPQNTDEDNKSERFMNLAIIVSIWCLSCVGIYTYWYKYVANLEYNKLIMDRNTRELNEQMKRYSKASEAYVAVMNRSGDSETTGETKIKKELYNSMVRTIELFEKCNYVQMLSVKPKYPYAEVMVACLLLSIVCGIVVLSNFTNNPADQLGVNKRVAKLRREIQNMDTLSSESAIEEDFQDSAFIERYKSSLESQIGELNSKRANLSQDEFRKLNSMNMELRKMKDLSQSGGGDDTNPSADSMRRLDLIRMKTNRLSTELNFLKSDSTLNQGIMTIVICVMTFYLSLLMLNTASSYTRTLYSGRLFADSRCV